MAGRTVTGPTGHVVVVGAALAGLSAALHLLGAGRRVTLLEQAKTPGGRAGQQDFGGNAVQRGARGQRHHSRRRHPAGADLRTTRRGKDHRPVNELDAAGITGPRPAVRVHRVPPHQRPTTAVRFPRRHSMRMDLTVTEYATYADLAEYVHGSASVIGLQMLLVFGTVVPLADAAPSAAAPAGTAFAGPLAGQSPAACLCVAAGLQLAAAIGYLVCSPGTGKRDGPRTRRPSPARGA